MLQLAPDRMAHASGALWLPDSRTLLIADAHLGYGWAQRRRGQLGPVRDTRSAPKIDAVMKSLKPERVVMLGDVVHAPHPTGEERDAVEQALRSLAAQAELIIVRGNHDRGFARDFGHLHIPLLETWSEGNVTAVHGDRINARALESGHVIAGHLHPVLPLRDAAGASRRVRVFAAAVSFTILPAFSPYAGGFDISVGLPPPFDSESVQIAAVTGTRVFALGPLDRIRNIHGGSPEEFRRGYSRS